MMRLNMLILSDWLREYSPQCSILEGKRILRGVRLLTDSSNRGSEKSSVLLCRLEEFIPSLGSGVVCVNGIDFLRLKTENVEEVYNRILDAFDFYNDWEDEMICSRSSLAELLGASGKVFLNSLRVLDSGYRLMAHNFKSINFGKNQPYYEALERDGYLPIDVLYSINKSLVGTQQRQYPFFISAGGN